MFPYGEQRFWGKRQITDGAIACWWKLWLMYGCKKQDVGPHLHFSSFQSLEKLLPSDVLVWPHMQLEICLQMSFSIWIQSVSSLLYQVRTGALTWTIMRICLHSDLKKTWPFRFCFQWLKSLLKSKTLSSTLWKRMLRTLMLPPLLPL